MQDSVFCGRLELAQLNAAPLRGTSLAELALNAPLYDKIGNFLDWMGNHEYPTNQSYAMGSVQQLTRAYITENFNPRVPDVDHIPYYSYSAAVGKNTEHPIGVVNRHQNRHIFEQEGLNNGMVSVQSAKWGEHITTGHLSHLEQINLNVKNNRKSLFKTFWLDVLKKLQEKGH